MFVSRLPLVHDSVRVDPKFEVGRQHKFVRSDHFEMLRRCLAEALDVGIDADLMRGYFRHLL